MKIFLALNPIFMVLSNPLKTQNSLTEIFHRLEKEWNEALDLQDTILLTTLISPNFNLIGAGAKTGTPLIDRKRYLRNVAKREEKKLMYKTLKIPPL